jgi:hypothetical protein
MKQMVRKDIGNYTFNAANGTITFTDIVLSLEQILIITNVTHQTMIYCFNDNTLGGILSGNLLVLDYDTSTMLDTDILQIYVDIPVGESNREQVDGYTTTELLTLILKEIMLTNHLMTELNAGYVLSDQDMDDFRKQ